MNRYGASVNDSPYGGASPGLYGGSSDKPKIVKETPLKPYYTFGDSDVPNIKISKGEYLRLIFWGGAGSHADNSSFYRGMRQLRKNYREKSVFDRPTYSAAVTIDNINGQDDGSIQSIDFLCHGGPYAVFFVSSKLDDKGKTPFHSPTSPDYCFNSKYLNKKYDKEPGIQRIREAIKKYLPNKAQSSLYSSALTKAFAFLDGGDDVPRSLEGGLADIEFAKFTDSARVEIHGCRTAEDLLVVIGTFCERFSKLLYKADKKSAVVIGHTTQSSPDSNSDYRRGSRQCLHNGTILFAYQDSGVISKATIDKYLDEKSKNLWDDYYPEIKNGKETKIKR